MLAFCGTAQAAYTVVCNGSESGGSGPRDYYYEITLGDSNQMDYFQVGTECGLLAHYTNIVGPEGWTFVLGSEILEPHYEGKTDHGSISPGTGSPDVDIVVYWFGTDLTGAGTYYFGFDNPHPSHDVGGLVEDDMVNVWNEDWDLAVGTGAGPLHGPVPEPATIILLGLGGLALMRRRKK